MTQDITSGMFESANSRLKSEHDSMVQKIKDELNLLRRKALQRVSSAS